MHPTTNNKKEIKKKKQTSNYTKQKVDKMDERNVLQ